MRLIQMFTIFLISINIIITFSEIINNNIDTEKQFMTTLYIEKYEDEFIINSKDNIDKDENVIIEENNIIKEENASNEEENITEEENIMNEEENIMNEEENIINEEENIMNEEENIMNEEENIMNEDENIINKELNAIDKELQNINNIISINDKFITMIFDETNKIIYSRDKLFSLIIYNDNILKKYSNVQVFNQSKYQNIDTIINYINNFINYIQSIDCSMDDNIIDNYKMNLEFITNKHINLINEDYMENIDTIINTIINIIIYTDKYKCDVNYSEKIIEQINIIKYKMKMIIYNNIIINSDLSLNNLMSNDNILFNLNNLLQIINQQQNMLLDIYNNNDKTEL